MIEWVLYDLSTNNNMDGGQYDCRTESRSYFYFLCCVLLIVQKRTIRSGTDNSLVCVRRRDKINSKTVRASYPVVSCRFSKFGFFSTMVVGNHSLLLVVAREWHLRLIALRIRFRAADFGLVAKIHLSFVQNRNRLLRFARRWRTRTVYEDVFVQRWGSMKKVRIVWSSYQR